MAVAIKSLTVKDNKTVHDDFLRTIKNGYTARGLSQVDVSPGSDFDLEATAVANETSAIYAFAQVAADKQMPDTATGSDLARVMNIYGLAPNPAIGSVGFIVFSSSASSLIAVNQQLTDSVGLRYQVTVGGTYANGQNIPVGAIDTGSQTNHLAGDTLKWAGTAPAYSSPNALVATGGLIGGADVETDDSSRARLLARLQTPPAAGNWQQFFTFAQQSSLLVQAAGIYPAVNGPSTVHVAVFRYASTVAQATARNRDVDSVTLTNTVNPFIIGSAAEFAEVVVTTVTNQPTDVAIGLTLPSSPQASPSGPGGGWLDGTPWPALNGGVTPISVTAVTSTTQITVNAPGNPPTASYSRIAFLDPITAVSGTAGAYVLTLDTAWPNIAVGNYIFPQSVNQQNYVNALLNAFANMGPGEKVAPGSPILTRGFRHPLPTLAWPYSLGGAQLRAIENSGNEVQVTAYLSRSSTTPTVPANVTLAPSILVPRNLAFYQIGS
jgi:uncharacterized phage protein gp47/JayE